MEEKTRGNMKSLKIALLQILPEDTLEGNLQKGLEYIKMAKKMGADIALFPEMWSVGYYIAEDVEELKNSAISADSKFIEAFGRAAKEYDLAIGITFLEKYDPLPRNSLCLFDRSGKKVLSYAKVHTCDFGDECRLTPGEDFYVTDLDTAQGNVKIGAMICYDREFPESARILMLKGAELVLVPNACPMEINRLSQLRARAYENMLGIATVNYPKGQPDCNGHSSAFDGIAYRQEEAGSRDTLIVEAGEREGIYMADFPIDEIRDYRSREVHGNAYRRPSRYQLLISEEKGEPFIRKASNKKDLAGNPILIDTYQYLLEKENSESDIRIRTIRESDASAICREEIAQGWSQTEDKYKNRIADHVRGKSISLVAEYKGNVAGYINIYPNSEYGAFANKGYCEIVDFGVLEKYRCHGIGSKLMDMAEKIAASYADTVYLGVGLHSGYGSAQRMYCKRGYIPDGTGIWYDDEIAKPHEMYSNDDDLVLYLSKKL